MPRTWNNGPPWRDLAGTLSSRCNTSQDEATELSPWKPGLGQGILECWNVEDPVVSGDDFIRKPLIY